MTWIIGLTLLLAFANGANDVSKGIATLVGSGVSRYRTAVIYGSICTVAGALLSALFARGLVETFSGNGILVHHTTSAAFLIAVACGAIGWLIIATATGLPVSTTHALVGALIGAAGLANVQWREIGTRVAIPLAVSPVMALLLLLVVAPLFRRVSNGRAVDVLHWISAGATSFFRGLNDTPKIVALGIAAGSSMFGWVALAMGLGSLLAGLRVTRTLAEKVTPITHANGFAANVVTSLLVGLASRYALPVSTTHVSSGAIIGIGVMQKGTLRWKTIGEMLLAWIVTLPVSALIAAGAYALLR
jgi:PiT family inorganic phosphate transporter